MTRSPVTREEIHRLAGKLEQFVPALSEAERMALHTVFELAASALPESASEAESIILPDDVITQDPGPNSVPAAGEDLPPLAAGFRNVFQPGAAARFTLENRTPEDNVCRHPAIKVRLV